MLIGAKRIRVGEKKYSVLLIYRCIECDSKNQVMKRWIGDNPDGHFKCFNCEHEITFKDDPKERDRYNILNTTANGAHHER